MTLLQFCTGRLATVALLYCLLHMSRDRSAAMSEAEDKLIAALRDLVREIVREELAPPVEREPKEAYSEAAFCRLVGISRLTAHGLKQNWLDIE